MKRQFRPFIYCGLALSAFLVPPLCANTIDLTFTVQVGQRLDYSTWQTDAISPFSMLVSIRLSDIVTGQMAFSPTVLRTMFGPVQIVSPLSSIVSLGFDPATMATPIDQASGAFVQTGCTNSCVITFGQNATYSLGNQEYWSYGVNLEFLDPLLFPPVTSFGSTDLLALLNSEESRGVGFGFLEGAQYTVNSQLIGGYRYGGVATLESVAVSSVPEPSSISLVAGLVAILFLLPHRKRCR